ncbi:MAG: NAD(+)--dinitrogen-reductase ADP-D-ribosyltransferase [Candidatus Sedimenticola sp. 6PFRAG7]
MDDHRQTESQQATLPAHARLPVNHCNLPAVILGGITFQENPAPLHIDGVNELHEAFFSSLEAIADRQQKSENFNDYMRSSFLLDNLEEAGFDENSPGRKRHRADYLRMLRGWHFDADGKEGAVLKGWVESRFGLLPRNHGGPLIDFSSENYQAYLAARAEGLYSANALEAQLDLLYSYCQYEIKQLFPNKRHITLYRGVNRIEEHEVLEQPDKHHYLLLLNNLSSFTRDRERSCEFGDYILEVKVPLAKLLYFPGLLPGKLQGEEEYLVIGGVYSVKATSY